MTSDYANALKEASFAELLMAAMKLRERRNIAEFFAVVACVVIWWQGWSTWTLAIPAIIGLGAAGQHFYLRLVENELGQRQSEIPRDETRKG